MKVFISHVQQDAKWADLIRRELRGKPHFDVWDSELEIQAGDNWALKTGKALASSDTVLVLLSPESVRSPFVRKEIDFLLTNRKFRGRVISLMVKPTKEVPWILHTPEFQFIDGTHGKEKAIGDVVVALETVRNTAAAPEKQPARR
jgi:hypothetical protein